MVNSALDVATRLVLGPTPVRETSGPNRSPIIDEMTRTICGRSAPLGVPYCAIGVSYCGKMADGLVHGQGLPWHLTASSQDFLRYGRSLGLISYEAQDLLSWEGALGGWTDEGDPEHGHVFFIAHRLTSASGRVTAIGTLEFNTSPMSGVREGQGAYALQRVVPVDRGHRLWFFKTSPFKSGRWWAK